MTTISLNKTLGVVLNPATYTNPIVIDAGVTITNVTYAIYASSGSGFWTVSNSGSVAATSQNGSGVKLSAGGVVINQTAGVIGSLSTPNASAIYILGAAGTVTNAGVLNGGVRLQNGGTVSNQFGGKIVSSSTAGGYGVGLYAGGTVTNQLGGTISGDSGVIGGGSVATVTNAGTIAGTLAVTLVHGTTTVVTGAGVSLSAGGSVNNQAAGAITGLSYGIKISTGAGTVFNAGQINASGTQLHRGVALFAGGYLSNASTGTIDSTGNGNAVRIQAAAGTIVNAGTLIEINNTAGRSALAMQAGGSVNNLAGGLIEGGAWNAIYGTAGAMTVVNAGTIIGENGVYLNAVGTVTNKVDGGITSVSNGTNASNGIFFLSGIGTVFNAGQIIASGPTLSRGVALFAGGYLSNVATGTISDIGNGNAVRVQAAAGTIVNAGTLINNHVDRSALALQAGGNVTNLAGGLIQAGAWNGIYGTGGPMTVFNAGTIIGNNGTAVSFSGTDANRLVLGPGFAFTGVVAGSTAASNVLELTSAVSAGMVTGLGAQFTNFGPITFDAGAKWSIAGNTSGLAGTISGFATGDAIVITGVTATGSSFTGGVLTLDETSGSATLNLPGTFTSASNFHVAPVPDGTEVTVACFAAGTRILTASGEVAVEDLRIGDRVATLSGSLLAPIVWLGHRHIDCTRHPRPYDVRPVCVKAGAIADRVPHRDLWLSPDHAVRLRTGKQTILVPVRHLVNGTTIAQVPVPSVTYWHVELATHDVIVAEGLPAESYLDTGNRANFANGGPAVTVHATFADAV